jgi:GNAT superfamily N-acetyltransferase
VWLSPLNRRQADARRKELAELYARSCAAAPGWEHRSRQDFLLRLAGDIRRPGFAMLVAEAPDLAGCAFGFPVRRDGIWWHGFQGTLPRGVARLTAIGEVFAVTGMIVRPDQRNRGLAGRMQECLLTENRASLGATLVDGVNRAAGAAFRSWGWQEIGEVHRPPGPTVLRALVLRPGERTAAEAADPARRGQTGQRAQTGQRRAQLGRPGGAKGVV